MEHVAFGAREAGHLLLWLNSLLFGPATVMPAMFKGCGLHISSPVVFVTRLVESSVVNFLV